MYKLLSPPASTRGSPERSGLVKGVGWGGGQHGQSAVDLLFDCRDTVHCLHPSRARTAASIAIRVVPGVVVELLFGPPHSTAVNAEPLGDRREAVASLTGKDLFMEFLCAAIALENEVSPCLHETCENAGTQI